MFKAGYLVALLGFVFVVGGCPSGDDDDAVGDDDVGTCDLYVSVDSACSACFLSVNLDLYKWDYSKEEWILTATEMMTPDSSHTFHLTPSPNGEVKMVWDSNSPTGDCSEQESGLEFLDCPENSGDSFYFNCN